MATVCIDAMGGDCSPNVIFEGVKLALDAFPNLSILLVGKEEVVVPFARNHSRVQPLVSKSVIDMHDHAAQSFRNKRDSSIALGLTAVKKGEADAFFSAGNTGAILTAATFILGRISGVIRPCLAGVLPGLNNHRTVVLDLGANADVRPDMLVCFAKLGEAYAQFCLKKSKIKLGLLSNGSEESKGNSLVLEAHKLLSEQIPAFFGNAEGIDVLLGDFDCIVTDGFTGNCVLKSIEGCAKYIAYSLKSATDSSYKNAIGGLLLKPALKKISNDLSGDVHGGACLLGVKAPVFVGHGSTSPLAVFNGCRVCIEAVENNLVENIALSFS